MPAASYEQQLEGQPASAAGVLLGLNPHRVRSGTSGSSKPPTSPEQQCMQQ
jgi:hypothetical protein